MTGLLGAANEPMTHRERFAAVMNYRAFDRLPVYWFGAWNETWDRWQAEGLADRGRLAETTGMDPEWESGMWAHHGMAKRGPVPDGERVVVEEDEHRRVVRTPLGGLVRESKTGSSIPEQIEPCLQPTREDWARFRRLLAPDHPQRWAPDWEAKADALARRERVACCLAGSLFGELRNWMGVENFTYLAFEDPDLYETMIAEKADFDMACCRPFLRRARFDFAYIFEDCCFNAGPLLSPDLYRRFYDRHYRRMVEFFRANGVSLVLLDSDGKVDDLIPLWLDSGIDIVFPIERGTWRADPRELRRRFGKRLRMMGGVDKHVIPRGEKAIRAELEPLRPLVEEGGFLPLPDHRIPPDCSLERFREYVGLFAEVFVSSG